MKIRVAVNGYGRIGRCVVRSLFESDFFFDRIKVVAINEMADLETIFHLTKYDSTHGQFRTSVERTTEGMLIEGERILVINERNPEKLPWKELAVDVVLECTGSFTDRKTAEKHIKSGAKKLIFSHPASSDVDATIVHGVNHHLLKPEHTIISNASCTTNCIVPILHILDQTFGIQFGTITTIHSAMHDQPIIDAYNRDLRKTRSAMRSIIPVSTGLDKGISRILPSLEGRFETLAIRVPTTNVSIMDLTVMVGTRATAGEVNVTLKQASEERLQGILGYTEEQLVSCDFNHDSRSAIVDSNQTRVSGDHLVKVLTWFDNEWGFSNRMLDTTVSAMGKR